jgi:predicted nucleic-acid-binding protein
MRAGTQAAASGEPARVSLLTLLETEWVLHSAAKVGRPGGIGLFKKLLECADLLIENEDALAQALHDYEDGLADFADGCALSTTGLLRPVDF